MELGEWVWGRIIKNSDNRGSTVYTTAILVGNTYNWKKNLKIVCSSPKSKESIPDFYPIFLFTGFYGSFVGHVLVLQVSLFDLRMY